MAIISAGVVMNVIFAFIFATIAYKLGVPFNPSVVSGTAPGSPAWRADVHAGDEIVKMGDIVDPSFTEMKGEVTLADLSKGLEFVIRRGKETMPKHLVPEQGAGLARVGIDQPFSTRLSDVKAAYEDSPAAEATPPLAKKDEIVEVDGKAVGSYADIASVLAQHPDKALTIKVRRGGKPPQGDPFGPLSGGELIDIVVPARPLKQLGLVMQMGKVVAVQENSPAAKAEIKPGDFIDRVGDAADNSADNDADGQAADDARDPILLPEHLRRLAGDGHEVELRVRRAAAEGESRQVTEPVVVALRPVTWLESPIAPNDPASIPALGVAYRVLNIVDRVEPGSPAAKAGMQGGDVVTQAEVILPPDAPEDLEVVPMEFSRDEEKAKYSWPWFMAYLQQLPPGSQIKLTYVRGDESSSAELTPAVTPGFFDPERGFVFDWIERIRIAGTWDEAIDRGWNETTMALGMVYRFLSKLGGQVPLTSFGGPITIVQAAGFSAFEGVGKLLVFLTMLSANLAVINFLPIPLLDGGHMVFLLWEGLRGKPAGEKFVVAMHTVGFVFIITLMLFVISLDLGLIQRNL
jgi:regulator of sigma E protease